MAFWEPGESHESATDGGMKAIVVECDHCFARHRYDEAKFEGSPSKKLRCAKCQTVFEVYNTHAWQTLSPLADTAMPDVERPDADGDFDRADHVFLNGAP